MMYKSKYNIPLEVENTLSGKEQVDFDSPLDVIQLFLSKFFSYLFSLTKATILVAWALISGLLSFSKSVWKDNPWLARLPWGKLAILTIVAYLLLGTSLGFSIDLNNPLGKGALLIPSAMEQEDKEEVGEKVEGDQAKELIKNQNLNQNLNQNKEQKKEHFGKQNQSQIKERNKNLSPISPALLKNPNVHSFIERFKATAIAEMKLFGIPASIKMGQAIIESQAGKSVLAANSNNFFGIKCKPKCLGCTCKNYADDNKYDMFRVFTSAWESWRAHSDLLCNPRYSKLPLYGKDYKKWAEGLKKAGYATDPSYATKLINVIEKYNLTMLDQ